LRLLGLSSKAHGLNTGGDAGNTSGSSANGGRSSTLGVVGIRGLIATDSGYGRLRRAIRCCRSAICGLLNILRRITTESRCCWLRDSVMRCCWLAAYYGIASRGNLECLGGVCSLLLLAMLGAVLGVGCRRRRSRATVCLLGGIDRVLGLLAVLLRGILAVAIVGRRRSRHGV